MGRQLGRLVDPLAIYFGEFPLEVSAFQAYNLKNFVSTPFSFKQQHGRTRNVEELRDKLNGGFVRFAFNSRRI